MSLSNAEIIAAIKDKKLMEIADAASETDG